jgi:hypothetical protein
VLDPGLLTEGSGPISSPGSLPAPRVACRYSPVGFDRQQKYKDQFALDPRNVRLELASDGFNPFGMLNVTYTTSPVILILYNQPPWLCLKQSYWMMLILIPGSKSPGINIDVYL